MVGGGCKVSQPQPLLLRVYHRANSLPSGAVPGPPARKSRLGVLSVQLLGSSIQCGLTEHLGILRFNRFFFSSVLSAQPSLIKS